MIVPVRSCSRFWAADFVALELKDYGESVLASARWVARLFQDSVSE